MLGDIITTMLPSIAMFQILQYIHSHYHSPGLALDIFLFPVPAQDIFFSALPTPRHLAVTIHLVGRHV